MFVTRTVAVAAMLMSSSSSFSSSSVFFFNSAAKSATLKVMTAFPVHNATTKSCNTLLNEKQRGIFILKE